MRKCVWICSGSGKGIWVEMTGAFLIMERRYTKYQLSKSFFQCHFGHRLMPLVLQARFPFLDEDVIATLLEIPLWEIAELDKPVGTGDKKILREVCS